MMWLKGCKRCRGDLFLERDVGSLRVVCLQCGNVAAEIQERRPKEVAPRAQRAPRRGAAPVPAA